MNEENYFRIVNFSFDDCSLELPELEEVSSVKMVKSKRKETNSYSIIIGPNGSGKSQLLGVLAYCYRNLSTSKENASSPFYVKVGKASRSSPQRLLAVSNLASDGFPFSQRPTQPRTGDDPKKGNDDEYFYLGIRQNHNMTTTGSLSRATRDNLLILKSSEKGYAQLKPVCQVLNITPEFHFKAVPANESKWFHTQQFENLLAYYVAKYRIKIKGRSGKEYQPLNKQNAILWLHNRPEPNNAKKLYLDLLKISNKARKIYQDHDVMGQPIPHQSNEKWEKSSDIIDSLIQVSKSHDIDIVELVRICSRSEAFDLVAYINPKLKGKSHESSPVKLDNLSTGEQHLLSMLARIIAHVVPNSLVLIDEPEAGLHPNWQSNFIPLLRRSLPPEYGCQFLIATHSPFLPADGTDLLVPGPRWGEFVPYPEAFQGRPVQNILYRVFHTRISGSALVEEDLRYLLQHLSGLNPHPVRDLVDRYWRLKNIAGPDTLELNDILDEAHSRLGLIEGEVS